MTYPPPLLREPRPAAITFALSKITEEMGPVPSAMEPYTRVTEAEEVEVVLPEFPLAPPLLELEPILAVAPAALAGRAGPPPCRIPPLLSSMLVLPPSSEGREVPALATARGFNPSFDDGGAAPEGRGPTSNRRTGPSLVPTATMQPQTSRHVGYSGIGISTVSVSVIGGDWGRTTARNVVRKLS